MATISTKKLSELLTEQFQQPFVAFCEGEIYELVCASAAVVSLTRGNKGTSEGICVSTLAQHGCPDGEWFFFGPFEHEPHTKTPVTFICKDVLFVGDVEVAKEVQTATAPLVEDHEEFLTLSRLSKCPA